ncbi:MAG: FAD-binding oxidoreductase, partial [Lysobacterales bacterium]
MQPLIEENRELKTRRVIKSVLPEVLGAGPLELVISGVRQLTPRIRAFELRDPTGAELPVVEAGSHLQVPVQLEDGESAIRHYSICSNPARRDIYEIAVLHDSEGKGGSVAAHEQFTIGRKLRCGLPQNHFRLHRDERPAVLIAGGIGITP